MIDLEVLDRLHAEATAGPWCSMRDGNQYISTSYMPTARCVGASRLEGPVRPWNPHAYVAFGFKPKEFETVRFVDADADLIAALHTSWPAVSAELRALREVAARQKQHAEWTQQGIAGLRHIIPHDEVVGLRIENNEWRKAAPRCDRYDAVDGRCENIATRVESGGAGDDFNRLYWCDEHVGESNRGGRLDDTDWAHLVRKGADMTGAQRDELRAEVEAWRTWAAEIVNLLDLHGFDGIWSGPEAREAIRGYVVRGKR